MYFRFVVIWLVAAAVGLTVACPLVARPLVAQTTGELAAFSALMVSPVGALPPLALDDGAALPARWLASVRYGGWRYDVDDGDHNNIGVTLAHRIANTRTTVAVSGAYLSLDCACSVWGSGSVAVRSIAWSGIGRHRSSGHLALQAEVGGARYTGDLHASALSTTASADVGVGFPMIGQSRMSLSIFPGLGYGKIWSVDETAGGWRPMIGGALSIAIARGVSLDLGAHRVVILGGPKQLGAGLSWRAR